MLHVFLNMCYFETSLMLDSSPNQQRTCENTTESSSVVFTLFPDQQESLKISPKSQAVLRFLTQLCIILKLWACHQTSEMGDLSLGESLKSAQANT